MSQDKARQNTLRKTTIKLTVFLKIIPIDNSPGEVLGVESALQKQATKLF